MTTHYNQTRSTSHMVLTHWHHTVTSNPQNKKPQTHTLYALVQIQVISLSPDSISIAIQIKQVLQFFI